MKVLQRICSLHFENSRKNVFLEHWIEGGGPTVWLTRSPDLNSLIFVSGDSYIYSLCYIIW